MSATSSMSWPAMSALLTMLKPPGMKALVAMEVLLGKTENELRLPTVRELPRAARLEAYAAAAARMAACVT
jgi:hypothetical protein